MLPRGIYEFLPWFYVATGLASGLLIDSSLVLIASVLLICAGVVTFVTRYQYRNNKLAEVGGVRESERRRGADRRQRQASGFPLVDHAGNMVRSERRRGDRRGGLQHGFA